MTSFIHIFHLDIILGVHLVPRSQFLWTVGLNTCILVSDFAKFLDDLFGPETPHLNHDYFVETWIRFNQYQEGLN